MLHIIDHHNSVTTHIPTDGISMADAHLLIKGLRFYENVYINYASDEPLFNGDDTPSWSNQDCAIYYEDIYTDGMHPYLWFRYEDGKWVGCEEPDFAPHAQWVQHEIS
jgi:hypothetical protein